MRNFKTTVRGALGRARLLTTARRAAPVVALALAGTLLVSALGPPAPAGAAAGPAARLQLVVKQVKIHDDRDLFDEGEMRLDVGIWRCKEELPLPCSGQEYDLSPVADRIARLYEAFGAGSGDTVTREWVVPEGLAGFAVYDGQRYVVRFDMDDIDGDGISADDDMGKVVHVVDSGEHGLGLGTHTARSFNEEQYQQGDYTVTYEIRLLTPVPDLRPVNIQVQDLPGSAKKRVCMGVVNSGIGDAGPFELALRVDGVVPPDGRATAGGLPSGEATERCVETELPTAGQYQLAAVIDEPGTLTELKEENNVYEQAYTAPPQQVPTATQPTPTPPTPTPSQAQPDLTVSAIHIDGRAPDGKDDCKEGKNDVAVVVKNAGAAKADFAVRLVVDGNDDEAKEKSVDGLDAGQEHQVRFDDVRLKQGERTLLAIADPKNAITEAKEDNNELKVTARCTDD